METPQTFAYLCYVDCEHLSVTEKEQDENPDGRKIPHICKKYDKQVRHGKYHPLLLRVEECDYKR